MINGIRHSQPSALRDRDSQGLAGADADSQTSRLEEIEREVPPESSNPVRSPVTSSNEDRLYKKFILTDFPSKSMHYDVRSDVQKTNKLVKDYGLQRLGPEAAITKLQADFLGKKAQHNLLLMNLSKCCLELCQAHTTWVSDRNPHNRNMDLAFKSVMRSMRLATGNKEQRFNFAMHVVLTISQTLINNDYGLAALWFLNLLNSRIQLDITMFLQLARVAFDHRNYYIATILHEFMIKDVIKDGSYTANREETMIFLQSAMRRGAFGYALDWLMQYPRFGDSDMGMALRAICQFEIGSPGSARYYIKTLLRKELNVDILRELAMILPRFDSELLGEFERSVMQLRPPALDLLRNTAAQWCQLNQPNQAVTALQEILDRPNIIGQVEGETQSLGELQAGIRMDLAHIYELLGNFALAAQTLVETARITIDIEILEHYAALAKQLGDNQAYNMVLKRLANLQTHNAALAGKVGCLSLDEGDKYRAIEYLNRALKFSQNKDIARVDWHRALAKAHLRSGQNRQATKHLRSVIDLDSKDWASALTLAQLLRTDKSALRAEVLAAYDIIPVDAAEYFRAQLERSRYLLTEYTPEFSKRKIDLDLMRRKDALSSLLHWCAEFIHHKSEGRSYEGPLEQEVQAVLGLDLTDTDIDSRLSCARQQIDALMNSNPKTPPRREDQTSEPPKSSARVEAEIAEKRAPKLTEISPFPPSAAAPDDPAALRMLDGREGEFYGLNRDGYPVGIFDTKLEWFGWNDELRAKWQTLQRDALASLPEEQIDRQPKAELIDAMERVLNTAVCNDRPFTVRHYAERVSGLDSGDGTKQPYECFLHSGVVRDAVYACNTGAAFAIPRDVDLLTTAPPSIAMRRAWTLDRENLTQYGYSGMSAHHSSYTWGTTSYGLLDISSVVRDGALKPAVFVTGHGWVPPVTFSTNLSHSGALRDLTLNCLVYCPKRKWLIELVPNAIHDAMHGLVRPASPQALKNPLLTLRALQYLSDHPGKISSAHLESFRENAQTFWNKPQILITSFKHLLGARGEPFNREDLEVEFKRLSQVAGKHGLEDLWNTHITERCDSLIKRLLNTQ